MSATVHVGSTAQWQQIVSTSSVVVTDFHADWCGPCKMIAPHFEQLSSKYSKPKKITFAKVDVDRQQAIAKQYSVSAMPTFLILHNGSVIQTVRGANPPALTAAVEKAVKLAGNAVGGGVSFGTPGQRLGGAGVTGASAGAGRTSLARPIKWDLNNFVNAVIVFFGLYFVSLFTFDAYKSAENSQFNKKNPPARTPANPGAPGQKPGAARPTFRTMADLGGDN